MRYDAGDSILDRLRRSCAAVAFARVLRTTYTAVLGSIYSRWGTIRRNNESARVRIEW